jgi:hypothetical protein
VFAVEKEREPMSEPVIPLSVFKLDCPEPPAGWDRLLESENVDQLEDDIGRASISREDARRLLGGLRAEQAYREDERRRRDDEQARRHAEFAARVPRGVAAPQPGMSAIEVMVAAGEDDDDRPRSAFTEMLDEALAAGRGT